MVGHMPHFCTYSSCCGMRYSNALPPMNLLESRKGRLFTFGALYFSEGLPGGFLTMAIATEIQRRGLDGTGMYAAFITFLALPWAWKFVMGPLVDNIHFNRFGARKQWIVAAQCIMITAFILAMFNMPDKINVVESSKEGFMGTIDSLWLSGIALFGGLLFLHNSFAATQDVAIDALACQTLKADERGLANGIMSSCSYAGYLVGGYGILLLKETFMKMKYEGPEHIEPGIAELAAFGPASFNQASIFVIAAMACVMISVVFFVREKTAAQQIADGELAAPEPGVSPLRTISSQLYDYFKTLWTQVILTRNGFLGIVLSLTPIGGLALSLYLSSLVGPRIGMTDGEIFRLGTLSVLTIFIPFNLLGGWLSDRFSRRIILAFAGTMTILPGLWMASQFKAAGWAHFPDAVNGYWPREEALITSWWIAVMTFQVFYGMTQGVKLALYMDIVRPKVAATQFTAMMAFTSWANLGTQGLQGHAWDEKYGWDWPIWNVLYLDSALGVIFLIWLFMIKLPKKEKAGEATQAADTTG